MGNEDDDISLENSPLANSTEIETRSIKNEQRRIYKNVLTVSLTFLLTFLAFVPLQNLQSSLNARNGIGLASLTVMYTFLMISSFFFTPLIINHLGCKWTMFFCTIPYGIYTAANFYPTWLTMIPSSILVGFAAGPLWAAKCAYLTSSAIAYAKLVKKPVKNMVSWFFGIFFAFFMTGHILGFMISSMILEVPGQTILNETRSFNGSTSLPVLICGANDCPQMSIDQFTKTKEPTHKSLVIVLSIFLCSVLASVIPLGVLVDKTEVVGSEEKSRDIKVQMLEPLRQFRDIRMMLFSPLIVSEGLFIGFISADFTKSYVVCAIGIGSIGMVLISYALTKAIFSLIAGIIVRYTGRKILLSTSYVLILAILMIFRFWKPIAGNQWLIYILSGLSGLCTAISSTQINAFLGIVFWNKQEASFANLRICQSLGFVISFAYGNHLCVDVKIYIIIAAATVSFALYIAAEVINNRMTEKKECNGDNSDCKQNVQLTSL